MRITGSTYSTDFWSVFTLSGLTRKDALAVAEAMQHFLAIAGPNQCWCVKSLKHPCLKGFACSNPRVPFYKGVNARLLTLALVDRFATAEAPVAVRKACCKSKWCINPDHYFFGTRVDVHLERNEAKRAGPTPDMIIEIRQLKEKDPKRWTAAAIARHYKMPYHVVRRICSGMTYHEN
jgi:hypothetical protein